MRILDCKTTKIPRNFQLFCDFFRIIFRAQHRAQAPHFIFQPKSPDWLTICQTPKNQEKATFRPLKVTFRQINLPNPESI